VIQTVRKSTIERIQTSAARQKKMFENGCRQKLKPSLEFTGIEMATKNWGLSP
jgi:hypothetical protein